MTPTLRFSISGEPLDVPVADVLNFGYAARDQDGLRAHLAELAERGVAAPATVPALYSLPPDRVTTAGAITVVGDQSYAEVEYALVLAEPERWLVTVASDHTDAVVEEADMPRGKGMAHDVLAPEAWWLDEVADGFDRLELRCERGDGELTQRGALGGLLSPAELIATLERRLRRPARPGTVVLSGTIDGHPGPGGGSWRIALEDPASGRVLEHSYSVTELPAELGEPAA